MIKIKNIISLVGLLCCTALTFVVVYAWYVNVNNVNQMKFNILQIDSLVTLYRANDTNFNGVPDKLIDADINKYYKTTEGSTKLIEYESEYYSEIYSFNYVDQRYALSEDSDSNLLDTVVINDILPSKIYSFKYEIINYAQKDNTLEFSFSSEYDSSDANYLNKLKNFDCRIGLVSANSDNSSQITFGDWTDFVTGTGTDLAYNGISVGVNSGSIVVPATTAPYDELGRLDLWLQIRVKADCEDDDTIDTDNIEKFMFPEHRLTLSIETPDPVN